MVLLDSIYWQETLPVEELLVDLSGDRHMAGMVATLDDVDEVIAFLEANPGRKVDAE